jgi:hypothetical protein
VPSIPSAVDSQQSDANLAALERNSLESVDLCSQRTQGEKMTLLVLQPCESEAPQYARRRLPHL